MKKAFGNPCSRCGTERIVVRTWKEKVDSSVITNTETACPHKECQIEVDKITGIPGPLEYTDKIVGIVEYRDGTIIDVIHQLRER